MPRKKTTLISPTESITIGSPSSAVDTYFLSSEELAEVVRKYPRVQRQVRTF